MSSDRQGAQHVARRYPEWVPCVWTKCAGPYMNQSAVPDVSPATLEVVPLGGLGEFGMNMMALTWEDSTILVDAGVMFPDPDQLGVDLIIPDLTYVEARRQNVKALILTHGHEDHIGGVPYVLPLFDGPV